MNHGAAAEALAERFLAARGLAIVGRNYRCRGGEIDIIARDGRTVVFVEVRLRRNHEFGGAAESITAAKRRRLRLAAEHYLARLPSEPPCRFDAILLDALASERIEWLRAIDLD
ncbi:MAG TPA: YraN family protein [Casimicrobiaceae bacterium]|nr:YraN family protein [Casimicrobiaceae bacterium]